MGYSNGTRRLHAVQVWAASRCAHRKGYIATDPTADFEKPPEPDPDPKKKLLTSAQLRECWGKCKRHRSSLDRCVLLIARSVVEADGLMAGAAPPASAPGSMSRRACRGARELLARPGRGLVGELGDRATRRVPDSQGCRPRLRILLSAVSAVSSVLVRACRYFSVVVMRAWPMRSLTVCRSAPPASSQEAWAWRRSCVRTWSRARRGRGRVARCGGGTRSGTCARSGRRRLRGCAGVVFAGGAAGGAVGGVGGAAVLAAAGGHVVGGDGAVPVGPAGGVRFGQAESRAVLGGGRVGGRGGAWSSRACGNSRSRRSDPWSAVLCACASRDVRVEAEAAVFLVFRVVLDQEPAAVGVELRDESRSRRGTR